MKSSAASRRPNILIITTHDSGRHFGCYGVPSVHTPAIDALAADGIRFDRMFSTCSICSPSRGSLMTGQYPQRNGLVGLAGAPYLWELTHPEHHLCAVLRRNGYESYLFGHQHEAVDQSLDFNAVNPCKPEADPDDKRFATTTARTCCAFLRQKAKSGQPFYAQVGFIETHTPFLQGGIQPDDSQGVWIPPYTEDFVGRNIFKVHAGQKVDPFNADAMRAFIAALQGSVRTADEAVGMILNTLRETGLERDTLVLFTTDHGVELPRAKWTMFDAGIGIAFIMRWPGGGLTGGHVCHDLLSNVDFVPTLRDLLGIRVGHRMDGISFASCLKPEPGHSRRTEIHALFVNDETYCTRTERHKLIRIFKEGHEMAPDGTWQPRRYARLYDLVADPLETRDLAGDPAHAAALRAMNRRFWSWLESVHDPILKGPVPTPSYRRAIADYHPATHTRSRTRKGK